MLRQRLAAAWHALLHEEKPPPLGAQVDLYRPNKIALKPLLRIAVGILLFGAAILAFALSFEALALQGVPPVEHHPSSLIAEFVSPHLWRRVLHEIGLAFVIASVVTFFIEYRSRREQNDLLGNAIQNIGHSVIEGVYKIRHDEDYIRTVVNSCLAIRHIRKDYRVNCDVYDFTNEECEKLGIIPGTLVKVVADLKYSSENIGNDYAVFQGKYYIPKRGGKLEEFAQMTGLTVGDKTYEPNDVEIKEDDPNYISSDRSYVFDIPAHPQKPVPVHITSIFVKERSDSEIFAFLFPTIGSSIQFVFHVSGLRIGAKARIATDTPGDQTITEGRIEWSVGGPLLPNNYVTVWWRSAVDDGEPGAGDAIASAGLNPARPRLGTPNPGPDTDTEMGTTTSAQGLQPTGFWGRGPFRWFSPSFWRRE
jgi:hypothetical protein